MTDSAKESSATSTSPKPAATASRPTPSVLKLIETALGDPDAKVRIEAVEQLPNFKRVPAKVYEKALVDNVVDVRLAAVRVLRRRAGKPDFSLFELALGDSDAQVRRLAVEELGHLGSRVPLRILDQALSDGDPSVRVEAVYVLGRVEVARRGEAKKPQQPHHLVRTLAVLRVIAAIVGAIGTFFMGMSQGWTTVTKIVAFIRRIFQLFRR